MTVDDAINVEAGRNNGATGTKKFIVHRGIICEQSPYFKATCQQTPHGVVQLPHIKPQHFQIYLQWTYSTDISISESVHALAPGRRGSEQDLAVAKVTMELWIMGNYFKDIQFKNEVMCLLFSLERRIMSVFSKSSETVEDIMAKTAPESMLRHWPLDYMEGRLCETDSLDYSSQSWPQDVVAVLLKRFVARARSGATSKPHIPTDSMKYLEKVQATEAPAEAPVMFPGARALETLNIYMNGII